MDSAGASTAGAPFVRLNDLLVNPRYVEILNHAGLSTLDGLFTVARADLLSKPGLDSWRQRLRLNVDDGGRSQALYIKRFDHPPSKVQRAVRRSGVGATSVAGVEWHWITRLAAAGISCPEPVAFGEERSSGTERRSALVMAAVPGSSLEQLVPFLKGLVHMPPPLPRGDRGGFFKDSKTSPNPSLVRRGAGNDTTSLGNDMTFLEKALAAEWKKDDRTLIRAALIAVARLVRRLHGLGCVHRDLYLSHLFLDNSHSSERSSDACVHLDVSVHLIDLQRVFAPTWGLHRWIVKDLAALNYSTPLELVSTRDRVRWLKRYLDVSKLDAPARRLVYEVVGKTRHIERHDRRRTARHQRRINPQ